MKNIFFEYGKGRLEIGLNLEALITDLHKDIPNLKLIVIDPLGGSMSSDNIKNYSFHKDYKILLQLQKIAMSLQIGILAIHHTRKGRDNNIFHSVSGTQGITAPADSVWILEKSGLSGKAILHVEGREREDGQYNLSFDKQLMEWKFIGDKIEIETTPERKEILNVFKLYPDTELKTGFIAAQLGKSQPNISSQLKGLKKEGFLVSGSTFGAYRMADEYINKI